MKIPQLFVSIGNNRFIPVTSPVYNKPMYFWDDDSKRIMPVDDKLKLRVVNGNPFYVLERT